MLRADGRYAIGAVVAHNADPPLLPGAGSCIFLHRSGNAKGRRTGTGDALRRHERTGRLAGRCGQRRCWCSCRRAEYARLPVTPGAAPFVT